MYIHENSRLVNRILPAIKDTQSRPSVKADIYRKGHNISFWTCALSRVSGVLRFFKHMSSWCYYDPCKIRFTTARLHM